MRIILIFRQQANLPPFIKELCERNQSMKLQQYPFLDLQKDMEQYLNFMLEIIFLIIWWLVSYLYYISCKEFRDGIFYLII